MEALLRYKLEEECVNLAMPLYQRILLMAMVERKLDHPDETIDELIDQATSTTVPNYYKMHDKTPSMKIATSTERQRLENELHNCTNLPEELFERDIVETTVNYYYKKFRQLV